MQCCGQCGEVVKCHRDSQQLGQQKTATLSPHIYFQPTAVCISNGSHYKELQEDLSNGLPNVVSKIACRVPNV